MCVKFVRFTRLNHTFFETKNNNFLINSHNRCNDDCTDNYDNSIFKQRVVSTDTGFFTIIKKLLVRKI